MGYGRRTAAPPTVARSERQGTAQTLAQEQGVIVEELPRKEVGGLKKSTEKVRLGFQKSDIMVSLTCHGLLTCLSLFMVLTISTADCIRK